MSERPELARDTAAPLVVEAVEALCSRLSLEADAGATRRAAEQALSRSDWADRQAVAIAFEAVAAGGGSPSPQPPLGFAQAFDEAAAPAVLLTGPGAALPCLVVLDRARTGCGVLGGGSRGDFRRLLGERRPAHLAVGRASAPAVVAGAARRVARRVARGAGVGAAAGPRAR
ncbi:MAG: hypothetical protein IPJ65_27025 [Archangiaceae bacterium]|nr:hypothetical protein [Archangiaceae bacterium]